MRSPKHTHKTMMALVFNPSLAVMVITPLPALRTTLRGKPKYRYFDFRTASKITNEVTEAHMSSELLLQILHAETEREPH